MSLTSQKAAIVSTLDTLAANFADYHDAGGDPRALVEYMDRWMRGLDPVFAQAVEHRRRTRGPAGEL
jgi:hypothetical protein